jgi:ADP-heptose:LPS heptosyltransferase
MIAITKRLSEKYAIVVVDQSRQYAWKDEDKGIDCAYGRPLLNLVELMRRSDIALVMDSGLQWIAHMAAIPMVSVLGPTRASERIVTHPLYPEGAKAINAATLYGCSPCYENARKCKWQYECLRKQNTEILGTAIENAIYEVLKNGTGRSNDQVIG